MRAIACRVRRLEARFGLEPDSEETLRLRARLEAAQQRLTEAGYARSVRSPERPPGGSRSVDDILLAGRMRAAGLPPGDSAVREHLPIMQRILSGVPRQTMLRSVGKDRGHPA